jgi:hypothetical protein
MVGERLLNRTLNKVNLGEWLISMRLVVLIWGLLFIKTLRKYEASKFIRKKFFLTPAKTVTKTYQKFKLMFSYWYSYK